MASARELKRAGLLPPALTFSLQYKGLELTRKGKRIGKQMRQAVIRASNKVGRDASAKARRELRIILNVKQKILKPQERILRANRNRPYYEHRWLRREFPIHELGRTRKSATRLKAYPGQRTRGAAVGVLHGEAYGKPFALEPVIRLGDRGGYRYRWLRKDGHKSRKIHGTIVKQDYRGPAAVKAEFAKRLGPEFHRQFRLMRKYRRFRV